MHRPNDQGTDGVAEHLAGSLEDVSSRQTLIKEVLARFEEANLASDAARDRIACEITERLKRRGPVR